MGREVQLTTYKKLTIVSEGVISYLQVDPNVGEGKTTREWNDRVEDGVLSVTTLFVGTCVCV